MLPLRARVDLGAMAMKGSDGNEGVLRIPQSSSIAGTSPSDCLVSYPGHTLGVVLPLCKGAVGVFYSPSRLGNTQLNVKRVLFQIIQLIKRFYFKLFSLLKQFSLA